jgi:hypothetical protein
MKWILEHQAEIPESQGQLVPEYVDSFGDYRKNVLGPMYAALDLKDDSGRLRHEFLNARAAVFRFGRKALEIRVLDTQECVRMDVRGRRLRAHGAAASHAAPADRQAGAAGARAAGGRSQGDGERRLRGARAGASFRGGDRARGRWNHLGARGAAGAARGIRPERPPRRGRVSRPRGGHHRIRLAGRADPRHARADRIRRTCVSVPGCVRSTPSWPTAWSTTSPGPAAPRRCSPRRPGSHAGRADPDAPRPRRMVQLDATRPRAGTAFAAGPVADGRPEARGARDPSYAGMSRSPARPRRSTTRSAPISASAARTNQA